MQRFNFWQKWLFVVSLGITTFGSFMALFNRTPLFDLFNGQIDPVFWSSAASFPESVAPFQGWLYGAWGATVAGWGIFLAFIAHYPFKQREKWAWNCLVWGLGIWFVLDTGISWYYGVTFNVVFNIVVTLAAGLPLVFTRDQFKNR